MNIFSNIIYFYKRKIQPGFRIKKDAIVIDIGSGDKPFWRADVFVDDLSLGNVQRASETKTIHDIGKFVDANVEKLPFKDNAFDFSFCSHLLEHVENPGLVIKEITRISKSGYIEIPNGVIETVQPFVSHLWFVYRNKEKLIFVRKSKKMHEALYGNGRGFVSLINKVPDPFIRMYWKNNIDYEVIDQLKGNERYHSPLKLKRKINDNSINFHTTMIKILRGLFYINKNVPSEILKKR